MITTTTASTATNASGSWRARGLNGFRVSCVIADPVAGHLESDRIRTIRRLLPHIGSFARMRQPLASRPA